MGYNKSELELLIENDKDFAEAMDSFGQGLLKLAAQTAAYNEQKAAADKRFKNLMKLKAAKLKVLQKTCEIYATEHKDRLLGEKKSADTRVTEWGFRKSPGVVKCINRKWTLEKSLAALIEAGKDSCIEVKKSLDKDGVKKHLTAEERLTFGLKVEYPELFWVEPKKEIKG